MECRVDSLRLIEAEKIGTKKRRTMRFMRSKDFSLSRRSVEKFPSILFGKPSKRKIVNTTLLYLGETIWFLKPE